jgi:hypothetical protein
MIVNTSLFSAQSGDYSVITQAITADDAIAFGAIYDEIKAHAESVQKSPTFEETYTLLDYVQSGVCVALQGYSLGAIATLKAVGLIATSDNVHIGLTLLGYGFYDFIQE